MQVLMMLPEVYFCQLSSLLYFLSVGVLVLYSF
ncbi:putative membrane protein, partial [Escherichia coli DEC8D]